MVYKVCFFSDFCLKLFFLAQELLQTKQQNQTCSTQLHLVCVGSIWFVQPLSVSVWEVYGLCSHHQYLCGKCMVCAATINICVGSVWFVQPPSISVWEVYGLCSHYQYLCGLFLTNHKLHVNQTNLIFRC